MELRDHATDDFLALSLCGYQFERVTDQWDSNWLLMQIDGSLNGRSWTTTDPCLDTFEVEALARWLLAAADAPVTLEPLGFTEPRLSFELADEPTDLIHIRIWLELEARPPWANKGFVDERDLALDLVLSSRDVRDGADALLAQLANYPTRVERSI